MASLVRPGSRLCWGLVAAAGLVRPGSRLCWGLVAAAGLVVLSVPPAELSQSEFICLCSPELGSSCRSTPLGWGGGPRVEKGWWSLPVGLGHGTSVMSKHQQEFSLSPWCPGLTGRDYLAHLFGPLSSWAQGYKNHPAFCPRSHAPAFPWEPPPQTQPFTCASQVPPTHCPSLCLT